MLSIARITDTTFAPLLAPCRQISGESAEARLAAFAVFPDLPDP